MTKSMNVGTIYEKQRQARAEWAKEVLESQPKGITAHQYKYVEYVAQQLSDKQIAEALNTNAANVARTLFEIRRRLREGCSRSDLEDRRDSIVRLAKNGFTVDEISTELSLSERQVRRDLQVRGVPPVKFHERDGHWTREEARRVCDNAEKRVIERRLARGMSIGEMALTDHISRAAVLQTFVRYDIPIPEKEMWIEIDGKKVKWTPGKRRVWAGKGFLS
jgi:DNA-binding CsgD family transcriptional regulator